MSGQKLCSNVYTIPAGIGLGTALAQHLLLQYKGRPEELATVRILLPNRRACRMLRESFVQQNGGKPMLLPLMHPVGDIDEDELSLSFFDQEIIDLPPAMPRLKRQMVLLELVQRAYPGNPVQALGMADMLGRLMDQITIEGADISKLAGLVPDEADLAIHWQKTLQFMQILTAEWPAILAEQGYVDYAERRNILIRALARQWREKPPEAPVIAAGSTGSFPATRDLLQTVANLPQGQLVLPGLDQDMDDACWDALTPDHPQYGLKLLLDQLGCARDEVKAWPHEDAPEGGARRFLASEMMRPASEATGWQALATGAKAQDKVGIACRHLRRLECDNEGEEAQAIALLLREVLETPGRTAALVTPDRNLSRRVIEACRRWGIALDDSAGTPLSQTRVGTFLRLAHETAQEHCAPVALLSLLKHDLCALGQVNAPFRKNVDLIELRALRGTRPKPGLGGIRQRLEGVKDKGPLTVLDALEDAMGKYLSLLHSGKALPFATLLKAHIGMAEALAKGMHESGSARLWAGEDGEACATFLAELNMQAHMMPVVTPADYGTMLARLMAGVPVRSRYGTHPRLSILGQLEARLVQADLVVIGGLNEGIWPADAGHDPWMSRPMRSDFGLPALERATGLSAHDFQQAFCAPNVVLTRARRSEGAPTVPSRWLQRLDTVLQACKITLPEAPHLGWARLQDQPENVMPIARPQPRPPAAIRPQQISVTRVETWLQDPYSIYARYVLRLKKLDALDKPVDAAERGSILHAMLEDFVAACPRDIPPNAEEILLGIAKDKLQQKYDDPALWRFWWPRLSRMAGWLAQHERDWRHVALPLKLEAEGRMDIPYTGGVLKLVGKADRIDKTHDGQAVVIDYKSGGSYKPSDMEKGKLPQLPLEAAMLQAGGFEGVPALPVSMLSYWKLSGGRPPGQEITRSANVCMLAESAAKSLAHLAEIFAQEDTPYHSIPRSDNRPRFNDYEHLSRIREWSAQSENGEDAA